MRCWLVAKLGLPRGASLESPGPFLQCGESGRDLPSPSEMGELALE